MDKIIQVVKTMKSKLNMYPDVCNVEITHSISYWINDYLIEIKQYLFAYIPLSNVVNHENMTRYHINFFHMLP